MRKLVLILLTFSFATIAFAKKEMILPKASNNDCNFYLNLENELKCNSESPYLESYGFPYCRKFQEMEQAWSGKLKKWVPETTYCLQQELVRDRTNLSPCKLMEDTAFGSHPTCYMKTGFCGFSYFDKQRVMNVVALMDMMSSFSQSTAQALRVKSTCDLTLFEGFFHLFDYLFQVTRTMDKVSKKLAGEILFNTPSNKISENNKYFMQMYYILLTGDTSLDAKTVANYSMMGGSDFPQTAEASFERCKKVELKNHFCEKLQTANAGAFNKSDTGKEFTTALPIKDIKSRIEMAHAISTKQFQINK